MNFSIARNGNLRRLKTRFSWRMPALTMTLLCASAGNAAAPDDIPVLGPKPFIAYFKPARPVAPLSVKAWGSPTVGPRDQGNGLEDTALARWNYWDGQILRADDGSYRMFASRWPQAAGHVGWLESKAVVARSRKLLGPYRDMGPVWPSDQGGKGHNVVALRLKDGRYAAVVSETRETQVFITPGIDGAWTSAGLVKVDESRYRSLRTAGEPMPAGPATKPWHGSNVSLIERPDGAFEIIQRSGQILLSRTGILGPYEVQGDTIYRGMAGLPQRRLDQLEDPVIWFSGGWYHVLVNHWDERRAYHLLSRDGISGWKVQGLAYRPDADFIRYANGTVNHWNKLERPGVVLENGHVVAITLAVIDVPKEDQKGKDGHGSKVIVIPFDGKAMDRDLASLRGK